MATIIYNIMKRVKIIYMIRTLAFPVFAFVVGVVMTISTVSIYHVIANLFTVRSFPGIINFLSAAVTKTDIIVQIGLAVALTFGIYSVINLTRALRHQFSQSNFEYKRI